MDDMTVPGNTVVVQAVWVRGGDFAQGSGATCAKPCLGAPFDHWANLPPARWVVKRMNRSGVTGNESGSTTTFRERKLTFTLILLSG